MTRRWSFVRKIRLPRKKAAFLLSCAFRIEPFRAERPSEEKSHQRPGDGELPEKRHREIEQEGHQPFVRDSSARHLEDEHRDEAYYRTHAQDREHRYRRDDDASAVFRGIDDAEREFSRERTADEGLDEKHGRGEEQQLGGRYRERAGGQSAVTQRRVVDLHAVDHDEGHQNAEHGFLGFCFWHDIFLVS